MRTACPECNASLVARFWVAADIFVERYACGSVMAWGRSDVRVIRGCPVKSCELVDPPE